jgi:O-antigen ligase
MNLRGMSESFEKHCRTSAIIIAVVVSFLVATAFVNDLWAASLACAILFATALWLLATSVRRRLPPALGPTLLLLLFLPLWGGIQILADRTVYRFGTFAAVLLLCGGVCAYWIGSHAFESDEVLQRFQSFLVALGVALSVLAVVQLLTSDGLIYWTISAQEGSRPMGPFRNRDRYAALIELLFPLALREALSDQERWALYAVGSAVMYASVVAGGSRAGFAATTLELLVVVAVYRRKNLFTKVSLPAAGVVVLLSLVLATALGWNFLISRFNEIDAQGFRRQVLISSVHMWRERPLLGFGLGTWPSVYPRFAMADFGAFVNHAHNDWAEWADDGGLPFFAAWLLVFFQAARRAFRNPAALGVAVVFLHSLVDFNFESYSIAILVAVLLAAIEAAPRDLATPVRRASS